MEQPKSEGNEDSVIILVLMLRKKDSRVSVEMLMMDHSAVDIRQEVAKKKKPSKT